MESTNDHDNIVVPDGNVMNSYDLASRGLHADDFLSTAPDVAPAMHVSTTFKYTNDLEKLRPVADEDLRKEGTTIVEAHVYSRVSAPNTSRLEAVISSLAEGHALTYSSGLSAFHALLCHVNPKVVAIGDGYHGCHGVLNLHMRLTGAKQVDLHDEKSWDEAGLGKGDIVHVETPLNPTGEAYNLEEYAKKAHARGAYLTVDATFGPPGLQNPLKHGADYVMHSGTKYIGGHSDMLCGVLVVPQDKLDNWIGLFNDRLILGSVMGSFEGWLGLRSIRTLQLRVQRQSKSAEQLVKWLDDGLNGQNDDKDLIQSVVERVHHASLQKNDMDWLKKQMPNGFGPVFSFLLKTPEQARAFPTKLHVFHHATSLGGVESLVEWRRMSDDKVDERLLRVSVGIEAVEDMINDFRAAFAALKA